MLSQSGFKYPSLDKEFFFLEENVFTTHSTVKLAIIRFLVRHDNLLGVNLLVLLGQQITI